MSYIEILRRLHLHLNSPFFQSSSQSFSSLSDSPGATILKKPRSRRRYTNVAPPAPRHQNPALPFSFRDWCNIAASPPPSTHSRARLNLLLPPPAPAVVHAYRISFTTALARGATPLAATPLAASVRTVPSALLRMGFESLLAPFDAIASH